MVSPNISLSTLNRETARRPPYDISEEKSAGVIGDVRRQEANAIASAR